MISDYKEELDKNGVLAFVPNGNSMWPTFKNGKQSVIILPKDKKLNKFDACFYIRKNGHYVLHRVLKVEDFGYYVCGDSQTELERVEENQVIGYVSGFYRGKKYIDASDIKYKKEVEKLYANENRRRRRIKLFYFSLKVKQKLKRIFKINDKAKGEK